MLHGGISDLNIVQTQKKAHLFVEA